VPGPGLAIGQLALLPAIRWDAGLSAAWTPGEEGALHRLEAFCATALAGYDAGRNRPDLPDTSRISPHLHFGEIGPRQCLASVRNAQADRPGSGAAAETFLREIGWREFAHHLLHHFPRTPTEPLDERFAHFPWSPDPAWLEAWQRGRTGFPIVDAGMRELWTTGWMHNRVRMIVASLLTCGADAATYFRVFNPALQAARHDPDGSYVRRWLPDFVRDYPPPLVDLQESRAAALAGYARIKAGAARPA
jgi:deoxyribodipyrimidine photo-lyase